MDGSGLMIPPLRSFSSELKLQVLLMEPLSKGELLFPGDKGGSLGGKCSPLIRRRSRRLSELERAKVLLFMEFGEELVLRKSRNVVDFRVTLVPDERGLVILVGLYNPSSMKLVGNMRGAWGLNSLRRRWFGGAEEGFEEVREDDLLLKWEAAASDGLRLEELSPGIWMLLQLESTPLLTSLCVLGSMPMLRNFFLMQEFQKFLISLSVRPGNWVAIWDHLHAQPMIQLINRHARGTEKLNK